MSKSGVQRPSMEEKVRKKTCVYDCRFASKDVTETWLDTSGLDFNDFLRVLHQKFDIPLHEVVVVATADRTVLDFDKFEELRDGSTLHMLRNEDQALSVATKEHIDFTPHYDTLVRGGSYEYYSSQGQKSLPYAIAELIDNALSATAKNTGARTIEIQMLFDETLGKPAMIVLDNGCGMTSNQLNNWAVYRLSKYSRDRSTLPGRKEEYVRPDAVPRSLNSDISCFGVGGKQAVFYIGSSTRMITKSVGSPYVHELVLSKEKFERKEREGEDIYSSTIRNRKTGDSSHVNKDERFLLDVIAEEPGKEGFTAVVITGVLPEHIAFLKDDFEVWTRQLAHIYHYYIHGFEGNDLRSSSTNTDLRPKIDIQITLREKPNKCPRVINLREVDDDMQTLFINGAADTFEFNAITAGDGGTVEGLIRYHPFLYDKETYPKQTSAGQAFMQDDDDPESGVQQAREKRPIFDCFWNGRLIPYTSLSEFKWCTWNKDSKVPAECYNRVSGVVFADDRFEVSTNKLTFMDLELKLEKNAIFTRVVKGQKLRGNIQRDFANWLQHCHDNWDKQIQFLGYKDTITRTDVPTKKMQYPWATFSSIEWDGKHYRTGQLVKSHKTQPILYGTVIRFLLYGDYRGEDFATGGEVELVLEPKALHDKTKTIPISKIDKTAAVQVIETHIKNDLAKLPELLKVDWPDNNLWPQNAVYPAGTPLGPIRVDILNKKNEMLSRMPSGGQGPIKKLIIEIKVVQHGAKGDLVVFSTIAQHSVKWGYWFKKIEKLSDLGKYTLTLNAMISESNATVFGDRALPSFKLNFIIKEGSAESFATGAVSSTLQVGLPFDIPLLIKDGYDHPAMPPPNLQPVLKCSGLDLSYEKVDISGTTFTIKSVRARGKVLNYKKSKPYDLKVILPGLKKDTQSINIFLLPGKAHSLHVTPEDNPVTAENGHSVKFHVEIHDEAGNITANPYQIVHCQVQGFTPVTNDCSSTGAGQLVTKPINVKIIKGKSQQLKVQFEMPNRKNVSSVMRELLMMPSKRVAQMELYVQNMNLVLTNDEKIEWPAGGLLENFFYRLYDEAGSDVPLSANIASKVKVNWTRDVNLKDLTQGRLPDIQVPTHAREERFYQVSYQDQSLSTSFQILPRPDEPERLKATLLQYTVKLGETISGNINLELVDQYDNDTKTLTSSCVDYFNVEAEGLDKSAVAFIWQESSSSVCVIGIRFQSGNLGSREICFTYREYVERITIKITAGVPAELKLLNAPKKDWQVLNESCIGAKFLIQLCDKWGNPSADQRVVVELNSSPSILKMKTAVASQPVDAEGKVLTVFTVNSVSGPPGSYQLLFRGIFNMKPVPGPSVNLIVHPDPNKPVSLLVEYDTKTFPAGGKFPVFSVTVVSDEGSPVINLNPADVSMFLWKGEPAAKTPPQTATELKCSKPMENEKDDRFHFRDKEIPEQTGKYNIQFSLRVDNTRGILLSDLLTINVVANEPVKLGPDSQPPTPVVSYCKAISNRTLVENMTLRIMDAYGNQAGQDLYVKVKVSIKNINGDNKRLPLFEDKTNKLQLNMEEGKVHISRIAIMEECPGEDGSSYILIFTPEASCDSTALVPFELPFHFYNGVENQRKMSELTKKRKELTTAVTAYKDHINTNNQLLDLLKTQYRDAFRKEAEQRDDLIIRNMNIAQTVSVPDIDRRLQEMTTKANGIEEMPRRAYPIPDNQFRGQQDVLGMVGHLALVQDDAVARVISWHISGDMDCVITKTLTAANRIFHATQGRQQVMPLETVFVQPRDRPLPHLRNGGMLFDPPGNPVYARDLLIFPQDHESCVKVFKTLLGETILVDDLDSANHYRKNVVQNNIFCSTILTKQGDRIDAKGKFGGAQNRAPPMKTLRMFGAPCPEEYYNLKKEIDMLTQYRTTFLKRDRAAQELDDHEQKMMSPEMLTKQQEMREKERQLEESERKLESTLMRPLKRGSENVGEPSGISAKRAKKH